MIKETSNIITTSLMSWSGQSFGLRWILLFTTSWNSVVVVGAERAIKHDDVGVADPLPEEGATRSLMVMFATGVVSLKTRASWPLILAPVLINQGHL
jgi:hypothetical protein